jgi:hypothetical protein
MLSQNSVTPLSFFDAGLDIGDFFGMNENCSSTSPPSYLWRDGPNPDRMTAGTAPMGGLAGTIVAIGVGSAASGFGVCCGFQSCLPRRRVSFLSISASPSLSPAHLVSTLTGRWLHVASVAVLSWKSDSSVCTLPPSAGMEAPGPPGVK